MTVLILILIIITLSVGYNQQSSFSDKGQLFYEIRNAKLPTYLPFNVDNFSYVQKGNVRLPTFYYYSGDGKVISVTIADPSIIGKSVSLKSYSHYSEENMMDFNGKKALYLNNGKMQMFSWEDEGCIYDLILQVSYSDQNNKPKEPFSKDEILKIASSFKKVDF